MRKTIAIALALANATVAFSFGLVAEDNLDVIANHRNADEWDRVIVLNDAGTLVANPAAMTPSELARATIVDPLDHLAFVDCGGRWSVDEDCPNWKEIKRVHRPEA